MKKLLSFGIMVCGLALLGCTTTPQVVADTEQPTPYAFDCTNVKSSWGYFGVTRCENSEVVCYGSYDTKTAGGISCKWKEDATQ